MEQKGGGQQVTTAYERAVRGFIQRCKTQIAINTANIKFLDEIYWMYENGLLTRDEWWELFEMV